MRRRHPTPLDELQRAVIEENLPPLEEGDLVAIRANRVLTVEEIEAAVLEARRAKKRRLEATR